MAIEFRRRDALLVHSDYADTLHAAGLDSLEALLDARGTTLRKTGLADWRERVVLELDDRRLFLKRYRRPPLREQLRQRLRGFAATAELEWRWIGQLDRLGIGAPVPVAFGQLRRGPIERASVIVTAEVPGCSLERWVPRQLDVALADPTRRRAVRDALAGLVRRLHDAGLVHRDLYLSHVFIDDADPNASPRLALIDLQRVKRLGLRRRRWIVKDLAALDYSTPRAAATRAERLRWFMSYRGCRRLSAADKTLVRAVVRKTRRIARHSARHGLG